MLPREARAQGHADVAPGGPGDWSHQTVGLIFVQGLPFSVHQVHLSCPVHGGQLHDGLKMAVDIGILLQLRVEFRSDRGYEEELGGVVIDGFHEALDVADQRRLFVAPVTEVINPDHHRLQVRVRKLLLK